MTIYGVVPDFCSDEDAKEAPFQPSGMSSRAQCYSAMGMSHEPKLRHSNKDKSVWADEAPVRVRQTRHDIPPTSPTVTPHGHIPARWKETTKNQRSSVGVSNSQVHQQNVHVRQVSADDKVLHSSVMEKDISPYCLHSSSLLAAGQKRYNTASTLKVSEGSKDTLNGNEDSFSLQSSSKSSMRSRESLRKLAETLGYLPTGTDPPTLAAVEPKEPPIVFKRSPGENAQSWGTSESHLYENLPDEGVVAAISAATDFESTDDTVDHLTHVSTSSTITTAPIPANYTKNVSAVVHEGGKKQPEIPLPHNADYSDSQPIHEGGAKHSSSEVTLNRTPSNITLNRVLPPPPEFAGDFDSGGEVTTEDQGRDFALDWTPHVGGQCGSPVRSKSEESVSVASSTLERRIFRVQQNGKVAASRLTTNTTVEATTLSVDGKGQSDKQDEDLSSCSKAKTSGFRPCARQDSDVSISKLPGYISVGPTEEPQHAERLFISNPNEGSDVEVSLDAHNSLDFPAGLTKPLWFTSETQLTSSASSSPGSKISQRIIAASSPKLNLLSDNLSTQPLSKLAKLVDQMQQNSSKLQVLRREVSTSMESDDPDTVRKKLQMSVEGTFSNDTLTRKEPGRREANQLHGSMKEYGSPKEDAPSVAASSERQWRGEPAPSSKPLLGKQQDPQYRAVGERRYSKKRTAKNTSELNATVAEQEREEVNHLGPGHAHPMGYVSQRQAQIMALPENASVMNQPSPMQSQLHSAEYYNDLIHPYAVSRRYYPDELSRMPPPSPSSTGLGYHQYVAHRMSPSPVSPQLMEEPMLSQPVAFPPNLRNSYQYHAFQTYSNNPFYHPARVINPATPPPVYLHPPNYYQGSTRREEVQLSSSSRRQPNGQEECFSKAATGADVQSGHQQLPKQQRYHTVGAHNSFQRPPSRADAPRGFMSPDQPVPHMLLYNQEPFPLSQPVDSSAYYHQQLAFRPNFRHSFGAASMNAVKPAGYYKYAAPSRPTQAVSKQQPTSVPYQPGDASHRRPAPHPRAHTPIVLTTPAASSNARRSKETLLEEDSSGIAYCLL